MTVQAVLVDRDLDERIRCRARGVADRDRRVAVAVVVLAAGVTTVAARVGGLGFRQIRELRELRMDERGDLQRDHCGLAEGAANRRVGAATARRRRAVAGGVATRHVAGATTARRRRAVAGRVATRHVAGAATARRRGLLARLAARVGGVRAANAVVAVTLVARVVVRAVRHLALRVLVVGVADAACTGLAGGLAVAVAVAGRRAVTGVVVRAALVGAVSCVGVMSAVAALTGVAWTGSAGRMATAAAVHRRRLLLWGGRRVARGRLMLWCGLLLGSALPPVLGAVPVLLRRGVTVLGAAARRRRGGC